MNGTIIILNGTSSAGKTSLVLALQKILPEPFLDSGIDKFIWMLPERYLDQPLWDEVLGLATQAGNVGRRRSAPECPKRGEDADVGDVDRGDHRTIIRRRGASEETRPQRPPRRRASPGTAHSVLRVAR